MLLGDAIGVACWTASSWTAKGDWHCWAAARDLDDVYSVQVLPVCLIQIITSPHSYSMCGIRRLDMKMNVSEHLQACLFFLHGGSTGVLLSWPRQASLCLCCIILCARSLCVLCLRTTHYILACPYSFQHNFVYFRFPEFQSWVFRSWWGWKQAFCSQRNKLPVYPSWSHLYPTGKTGVSSLEILP